jgi:KDO2-lipid IV(A) lauroyltransferase
MKLLTGWLARGISAIIFYGPYIIRQSIAYFLAFLWFDLFRIRRKVLLENLDLAFPEKSRSEKTRIGRASIRNLGLNLVEYAMLPFFSKANYHKHFVFENTHVLDTAQKKGKGVLLLTLHLGHGDIACAGLSLQGYKMLVVSKFFKMKWLNDLWFGMRERSGTSFIPPRDSSYQLLKGLKAGANVAIPLDQFTGPPIGVRTTFFGHETGTAAGLAVMAQRSGAPVVLIYTIRLPDGRHMVRTECEIAVPEGRGTDESTQAVTQGFNDELQKLVQKYPEQWMWIHRRWKRFVV